MTELGPFWTGARRWLMILMFGNSLSTWEAYVREHRGEKLKYRYYLGLERAEWEPEPRVRIWAFWDGKEWNEKELRAQTYRTYVGAWWRAFVMAKHPDIVIMKRPYSPRDWSPRLT